MRNAISAAAGLAIFLGTACSSSTSSTSGSTTGPQASGGSGTTTGTGSGGAGGAPVTSGGTTGTVGLGDGVACSSNAACQSGVCGLDGTGNCCTTKCTTDIALCAATACADTTAKTPGACMYPVAGAPCNSSCQFGLFTGSTCDGEGACSPQMATACPNNLACNSQGTACEGTCNPTNGDADCSAGWYCAPGAGGGVCTPQVQLGPCASNAQCMSNVCGIGGTGHCCTQTACTNTAAPCGTTDCDNDTGECDYPPTTTQCSSGPISCPSADSQSDPNTFCDGMGNCAPAVLTNCSPYACSTDDGGVPDGGCLSSCSSIADCAKDFYCSGGTCIPQSAVGSCTEDQACISLQCVSGNCCYNFCGNTNAVCSVTACDPIDGSCIYPDGGTACGTVLESCSNGIQQNPGVCDGLGNCPQPGTTACTPFICGATACLTSCTSNADCATGDTCALSASVCCPSIQSGGTLNVDSSAGSDTAACCGLPGYQECQTIGKAMQLIDAAQASNVTLNAYINGLGNGGNWTFGGSGDSVPITLGWGVELVAPTVNFCPNFYNLDENNFSDVAFPEIFDVAAYSASDTLKSASIVGSVADGPVQIGADSTNNVTNSFNNASVQVENGAHLYIANANLYSNYYQAYGYPYWDNYSPFEDAAIIVEPGGHLTLGQDATAANTGTVTVGVVGSSSDNPIYQSGGWNGLICLSDYSSLGCTVDDAKLPAGTSSLIMASMGHQDIDAEDFANITLISAPQFGVPPNTTGFYQCPYKGEGYFSNGTPAILLNGYVTVNLTNPTIQCVAGNAITMNTSPSGNGNPLLTISGGLIQNTERALYASAGNATVSNATIWYNYNGVEEDTDGTNSAAIDLEGSADGGTNTIVCTSSEESYEFDYSCGGSCTPSVNVLNTTANVMNASNVKWDTKGPDEFSCDSTLTSCTCEIAACVNAGGVDDMDAVYTGAGTITTAGNTLSAADCTPPTVCNGQLCSASQVCCDVYDYDECWPSDECYNGVYP